MVHRGSTFRFFLLKSVFLLHGLPVELAMRRPRCTLSYFLLDLTPPMGKASREAYGISDGSIPPPRYFPDGMHL